MNLVELIRRVKHGNMLDVIVSSDSYWISVDSFSPGNGTPGEVDWKVARNATNPFSMIEQRLIGQGEDGL